MRIPTISLRSSLALAVSAALLAVAPAAASQQLALRVGDPIPYRVSLPENAEITDDGEFLFAETDHQFVLVGTVDLAQEEHGLPVSDTESRRIMTQIFMGSDSLLVTLLDLAMDEAGVVLQDREIGIRTLGGERAAYLRGWFEEEGEVGWVEMHLTVKDGIMYMLMVATRGRDRTAGEALATRVHESFVLADGPPPAASRVERVPGTRPRKSGSR